MTDIFNFLDFKGIISLVVILFIMAYHFIRIIKSKDYYFFWSPITFVLLIFFYYTIFTPIYDISLKGKVEYAEVNLSYGLSYSYVGACLSLCSMLIGFKLSRFKCKKEFNMPLQENKLLKTGIIIFLVSILFYGMYMPLSFSITQMSDDVEIESQNGNTGNYLLQCIGFLCCACCLFIPNLFQRKRYYLCFFILFAFITYIVGGFRFRIVYLIVSMATMYHLYFQKRIRYGVWIPVAIGVFLLFGIMNFTRSYSKGLDLSKTKGTTAAELVDEGRHEGSIFYYSGAVMKQTEDRNAYIYFKPVVNAVCQAIPRNVWSDKPYPDYLMYSQLWVFGTTIGAAYMNYTEGFFMFGWFGVILNGLFLGWISKYFWSRYLKNRESLNSILLLSLYNGFVYFMISRGHLSQILMTFFFFLIIPYFLYKKMYFIKL